MTGVAYHSAELALALFKSARVIFKIERKESRSVLAKKEFNLLLRALSSRNYRLYFFGQAISLIGTWMQQIAMRWLVYRLTKSELLLGVVGFATDIPVFFLTPVAGVLVDKFKRHHILVITEALAAVQAFILAILVITDQLAVWHLVALGAVLGTVSAFEIPARQALLIEVIESKEDLGNAIALNSFIFNGALLIGPLMAGILIGFFGDEVCYCFRLGQLM